MDTTGQAAGTRQAANGHPAGEQRAATPGADPERNGHPADSPVVPGGHEPVAWVRVADLYPTLGADPRTVRRWVARNVAAAGRQRREGSDGGSAELFLRADLVPVLREAYPADVTTDSPEPPGGCPVVSGEAADKQQAGAGSPAGGQRVPGGQTPGAPGDGSAGWEALVAELRADRDRLRAQLETERVAREAAARNAEEAERGRYHAEARLEGLRAAWWRWLTELDRLGRWRRWHRRWPEPPAELRSERLLGPGE